MNKVLNAQNTESDRSRPPESKGQRDRDEVEIMRGDVPKLHPRKGCSGTTPRAATSGRVALRTQERVTRFLLAGLLVLLPVSGLAQSLITTYAGGMLPIEGALATTQSIGYPGSVISDRAGGFYFSTAGPSHHRVYRVSFDGTLRAIAGDGTQGFSGDGGPALSAQLNYPDGLVLDGSGNLFIADSSNNRIRKVTPAGVISTVAGTGAAGFNGDGGPAISALLSFPADIALDSSGALYISDRGNNRIRKVSPAGAISTVAGTGTFGFLGDEGQATSARLGSPRGIAVDAGGNILIADSSNARVRRVATNGVISTVAGNGSLNPTGDGGPATSASLGSIDGIALDASGALFIAASGNARIRKVADGIISTVAGNGSFGFDGDGGPATSARLASPAGVGVDATGNLFIADSSNNRIRKVTPAGIISTVAGNGNLSFPGDGGLATLAALSNPNGIALDSTGNLFIADSSNSRIRKVTPGGIISSFATDLNVPGGVAVDSAGNVFTTDCNDRVIKTTPAGVVTTFSSTWTFCSYDYYYDDDYYDYYDFSNSGGVAVDSSGNLFVADAFNNRVHKLTPDGTISLVAGTGASGFAGDGGSATSARLSIPSGVAVDAAGNLFIADSNNNRIRKVSPDGVITTIAGNGSFGFSGDGGSATSARLGYPNGVAVDVAGNLYIADTGNNRIRKVTPSGIISTVAGNGTLGFSGDGGAATSAQLNFPLSVTLDALGNLFISDSGNNRVRRVGVALTVPTLSGLSRNIGARGTSFNVTLAGTSFASPLTIDAGSGITVSNVTVVNELLATATFTVASNAAEVTRNVKVTTSLGTSGDSPFTVVPPYPDLSITSSHTGNLAVGFDATYVVGITNVGSAHTTGPLTVTDALPAGLTYVSGEGNGWSCASAAQIVTCENPNTLPAGASTNLNLTVAVGGSASAGVIHAPVVSSAGDLTLTNNATSDLTTVAVPAVGLRLTPQNLLPGGQGTVDLTVPTAFPQDVTGTLTLGFSSDAVNPADDPAIQFETGGRVVAFTIPANTLQARFGVNPGAPAIGFQTGTVSGTVSLNGTLQTGAVQTPFSGTRTIPRQAPKIHSIQNEPSGGTGFKVGLILSSTLREVTQLIVRFQTTPQVRLDCGPIAGCVSSGSTFTLDVRAMFDAWFVGDTVFGSLSTLHVPFFVDRTIHGSVMFSLTNRIGTSNSMTFEIP